MSNKVEHEACPHHIAHETRITRNRDDIRELFSLDGRKTAKIDLLEQHFYDKVDSIKNMMIAGLCGTAFQLLIFILGILFTWVKLTGGKSP